MDITTDDMSEENNKNQPVTKKIKLSTDQPSDPNTDEVEKSITEKEVKLSKSEDNKNETGTSISNHNASIHLNVEVNEVDDEEADSSKDEEIEEGFKYSIDMDASDMLFEADFDGVLPSVTERYFTPYYQIDAVKPGDDVCIRVHSNRICMISLAPSHTIFQENKAIVNCNFKVSEKLDRLQNKVSGKAKHGAQPMQANSNLCCLTCDDDSKYMVKCCMIGKLVEVNESLVENPELLRKEPHHGGYIATVLPNLKHLDRIKDKLLTEELYQEAIKKRKEKKAEKEQEQVSTDSIIEKENNVNMETNELTNTQHFVHCQQLANKEKDLEKCDDVDIVKVKQTDEQYSINTVLIEKKQDLDKDMSMEVVES